MSETLQAYELPRDFPIAEAQTNVNVRKALAGIYLLQGRGSTLRCLLLAGFSRATARLQKQNGLKAEACIAEAAKWDRGANPAKMLEAGRRRAFAVIDSIDPSTVPLKDAMKMLDTVEKYYGGHELAPANVAFGLVERLAQIASLLAVAQHRGLPVPKLEPQYVEAKVVSESVTSTEDLHKCVDRAR